MKTFNRPARTEAPHISIYLDADCHPPFRPASRVAGAITIHSTTQRQLSHAEAIFFGRSVTHCTRTESQGNSIRRRANFSYNETIHYHDDACLFRFSQDLSGSSVIDANRPRTFRFGFAFGEAAKLVGPTPYHGPTASSNIYAGSPHPLPPTFERYFNDHHYAFVEYRLQAVFQMADSEQPFTMHLPLHFCPTGQWPDPMSVAEYIRPPERSSINKFSAMQRFTKSSSQESGAAEVTIKSSLNTQTVAPSTLPIHVCAELRGSSSPSVSIPHVDFKIKSVMLYQITFFRARHVRGYTNMREYQEIGEDGILLNATPSNITADAKAKGDSEDNFAFFPGTFELKIPESMSPSFNSFNINHNYQLKATVEANVFRRKFEHTFVVESFTVLPPA